MTKNIALKEEDEDEEGSEEVKVKGDDMKEPDLELDFHTQILIREEALNDIEAELLLGKNTKKIALKLELVENPPTEILAMAQVKLINKRIFDTI